MAHRKSPEEVNAFVSAWQLTVKYLFLVEGGALIAILALIGQEHIAITNTFMQGIKCAASWLCWSLVATLAFSILISLVGDLDLSEDTSIPPKVRKTIGFVMSAIAIFLPFISLYLLYRGIFAALNTIGNITAS